MTKDAAPCASPMSEAEARSRFELAAAYRIADHYGWANLIYNHLAMRIPGQDCFLIKPHNKMFSEVRASELLKLRLDGTPANESDNVNAAGFTIHTAVLNARPDLSCTVHVHTKAGIAMSAHKGGLLPLNQGAMRFYKRLSYHDYEGIAETANERERIERDLGPRNKAMILRNHGLLTAGATVSEAVTLMRALVQACEVQLLLQACSAELVIPAEEVCERTVAQWDHFQRINDQQDWLAYLRIIDAIDVSYRD